MKNMETKQKVDISQYKHSEMYQRFIKEKTPGVCVTGKFDVTNIRRINKRKKHKFNALLCFAVMQAAQKCDDFHYQINPDGLYYYQNVKVNSVVRGDDGGLYNAEYKYTDNFYEFEKNYLAIREYCKTQCKHYSEDTGALISTSAMIGFPFESAAVNLSDIFIANFLVWSSYKKSFFKTYLNITLRFHHATIEGQAAALFFKTLQEEIKNLKI